MANSTLTSAMAATPSTPTVIVAALRRPGDASACGAEVATSSAGMAASAASAAATPKAGRNERVTASVTVSINPSLARPRALSGSAPRSSNTAPRSGT